LILFPSLKIKKERVDGNSKLWKINRYLNVALLLRMAVSTFKSDLGLPSITLDLKITRQTQNESIE
jgi:hypothetical protein